MSVRHKITLVFLGATVVPFIIIGTLIYLDFERFARSAGLPSSALGYPLLSFFVLLILFVLLIGSLMSQVIVRPIVKLSAVAEKIRRGDFTTRADVKSKDEIGRLAADFNAMAQGLEDIDRAKVELTAVISHQLRTPSVAIQGLVATLFDYHSKGLSAKQKELIQAAYNENEKMQILISRILDVVQLSAADLKLEKSPMDLGELAKKSLRSLSPQLKTLNQKVRFERPENPVMVRGNAEKLLVLAENLISNASKYSPKGTEITVALSRDDGHGVLQIKDQGYGIAKKDMAKLFDMFTRFANPNFDNIAGSGLGLYLVKRIVEAHGGNIRVDSAPDKGSTFTVRLPLAVS